MKERLIDEDGIIDVGACRRRWESLPRIEWPAMGFLCGRCRKFYWAEDDAAKCLERHGPETAPANEDR